MKRLVITTALVGSIIAFANQTQSSENLIKAIHKVESGGRVGKIVGDKGRALGPLQIHYSNWKDATSFDKTIGGTYLDCEKLEYSTKIFNAYMNRYAKNKSNEAKARIWNGGPKGDSSESTLVYWKKVKANL